VAGVTPPTDPSAEVARWRALCAEIEAMGSLLSAEGAPTGVAATALGERYLTRFLAAGLRVCLECDDPDYPRFGRMVENTMSWGLDNPDCNYAWARVRGDAEYTIEGTRGSARHLEFQVNTGHLGDGNIPALGGGEDAWRTVSFLAADTLVCDADGRFEITLSAEPREGNWLALDPEASHVLLRQYFSDWEREQPASATIQRVGASYPRPPLSPERWARHRATLRTWLDAGLACWDRVSRLLLSLESNRLLLFEVSKDTERPGLHGQSYGMGPFACARDEALVIEFEPPSCLMWGLALSNFWWESLEFGARQTSLNDSTAALDADGCIRAVVAHEDPGVLNWLDPEGNERGTLALRFLFADRLPEIRFERVPLASLRAALPATTPSLGPGERSARLASRDRALQRRYGA
jgi:hypothetical protein